jgi:hypothetical protein
VIVSDGRADGEKERAGITDRREESYLDFGATVDLWNSKDRLNLVKGAVADHRTGVDRHQRLDRVRDRRQGIACANDLAPQTRGFDRVSRVGERGPNGSAQSGGRGRTGAQVDAGP